ncbi:endonuclease III domain-containing protein [Dellaglioa sp. BT-FLS60]
MKTDKDIIKVLNRLADHYGPQNWWSNENPISDWVTMILIQQSTGVNVEKAMNKLAGYLTVEKLQAMDIEDLQERIRSAGFYKQKSAYIKNLINWFAEHDANFDSFKEVTTLDLRKELLAIKGIGPETADDILLYTFGRNVFIADQYAMRLFGRIGFGEYKTYAKMQADFTSAAEKVPLNLCREWHAVIDEHGKAFRKDKDLDESWLIA